MRFVNNESLRPTRNWLERAGEQADTLSELCQRLVEARDAEAKNGAKTALRKAIKNCAALWSELKPDLESLSFGKCWYCETKEDRSHLAVDHFRPKSGVAECRDHPGYWWLALSYENYRYACTYCNCLLRDEDAEETYGKGTHFPLVHEERRAFAPGGLINEVPCLLDPTVAADPSLLWFMDDGLATPKFPQEKSAIFFRRADVSIGLYNLNHSIISQRRSMIAFEIKHQVTMGDRHLDAAATGNVSALELFQEVYRSLQKMIAPQGEYSASARAVLSGYKDKEWVMSALITN